MTDHVNEFLRETGNLLKSLGQWPIRTRMHLESGLAMSVQASNYHYCEPRLDDQDFYSAVEIGFPNQEVEEFLEYAEDASNPCDTVYGWVPIEVVNAVIEKHGGIIHDE